MGKLIPSASLDHHVVMQQRIEPRPLWLDQIVEDRRRGVAGSFAWLRANCSSDLNAGSALQIPAISNL